MNIMVNKMVLIITI